MTLPLALAFTLREEGGYVDNPHDAGGATNRGITQATYDTWREDQGLPIQTVRSISEHEVQDIYSRVYWTPGHCAELSNRLGVCHFDWCVNHGVIGAVQTLQQSVGVDADGSFGPHTRTALEGVNAAVLCDRYMALRRNWYLERARTHPDQTVFLRGWLGRCDRLQQYLESIP